MGLVKGTVMGLTAAGGAAVSYFLVSVTGIPYVDWVLGAVVGCIAGDLIAKLLGQPLALGRGPGIIKGLIAGGGGAAGLYFGSGFVEWVAITWVSAVLGDLLL